MTANMPIKNALVAAVARPTEELLAESDTVQRGSTHLRGLRCFSPSFAGTFCAPARIRT